MEYRIEILPNKKLVGMHLQMTFAHNKTFNLWKGFMPRRKEISQAINSDLISLQLYSKDYFRNFNPQAVFEKWAAVEVSDFDSIPEGMSSFVFPSGLYAVFLYKGRPSDAAETFKYILGTWMSNEEYSLDNRPHFEILGEKYQNDSPDSEEELWIPIKPKG